MSTHVSRLRARYRPQRIRVLFVAESPPESPPELSEDEVRFFYNARQERWDQMYRSVMKAIFPGFVYRPGEKDDWLRRFQMEGYYLIDATDRPVNRLPCAERRKVINAATARKLAEIKRLVSRSTPIILVKKNIFSAFSRPLRDAGYNVIHKSFLPFPSHGHQARFVRACRNCLRRAQEKKGKRGSGAYTGKATMFG